MEAASRPAQSPPGAAVIPSIVSLHAAEAAGLYELRFALAKAPHVGLHAALRMDRRLAAHLDGLSVAGESAWAPCEAALAEPSPGAVFVAAVRAIEERQRDRLDRIIALAATDAERRAGLIAAFGWLERRDLQGIVADLLTSSEPLRRLVGVAACGAHRVDPGLATGPWLADEHPLVRASALRVAGEIGCGQARAACVAAVTDADSDCQFWAAWSSVLLGDRGLALNALVRAGLAAGPYRPQAFALALQAMGIEAAHAALQQLSADAAQLRWLIRGSGIAGDPMYLPWLVGHMAKDETARLSGEAFTLITGAGFDTLQLARARPEALESGPSENPEDGDVEMDPDEALPWPDLERVRGWWDGNTTRFSAGTRFFMGAPVTPAHCLDVLRNGCQRQRILAAQYRCLLAPGVPLFDTSAPAWRQHELLAQMD